MADKHFKASGAAGKVAVWTGADDAPFNDPLSNLSRVLFHSDLLYPPIVAEVSGTVNLPARGQNSVGWAGHNLFAHGRSGTPLVIGYVIVSGQRRRIAGSYPVQRNSRGWARWISIGADTTNVKMAEGWFSPNSNVGGGYGATSLSWRVFVLDTTFEATPELSSEGVYISETDFRAGRGKFDARKRYLRNGNTLQNFPILRGRSLNMTVVRPSNYSIATVGYGVAGDVFRTSYQVQPSPGNVVNVNGPSFAADYSLVTT